MTDLEFERMLSATVKFEHCPSEVHPCLREMIFNYFNKVKGPESADWHTKKYIHELYTRFVNRKA